jgi:CRP-like cAMP-binding protein
MEARMIEKLLLKLRRFDMVSAEEEQALRAAMSGTVSFRRGQTIVRAKMETEHSNLLLDGFVYRYKDLKDGARQTLQVSVPGDFIDLHSFLLKQLDHDMACFTACRIALFPHDGLRELVDEHRHLGRLLWLTTVVDAAVHREWMLSLGRRDAFSRLAHIFCELQVRLTAAGSAEHGTYELPLTQTDLAEMLGLTPVHVNRMLKRLRERGMLTFRKSVVEITDWEALVRAAEFDPFYLSFVERPR